MFVSFKENEMLRMFQSMAFTMTVCGAVAVLTGCGDQGQQATNPPPTAPGTEEHGHSHGEGPNGGAVADWGGGEYHVEFTVNHDTQEATVYVLDSNAKLPAPVKAEKLLLTINDPSFQVDLLPMPLEGETDGASSRFAGKDEKLGVVQEFAGTISGEVDGTPYAGDFKEEPHGH